MKSFVKIYGPPIWEAIKELEKIAVDMPEVCIMDEAISYEIPQILARDIGGQEYSGTRESIGGEIYTSSGGMRVYDEVSGFFLRRTGVRVPVERCHNIISKSGEGLEEFDFFFEWFENPNIFQLKNLIEKIDEALTSLGCYYTTTTK